MCVITDQNHVVVSISLIPGVGYIPPSFHVYFPVVGELPKEGDVYKPE